MKIAVETQLRIYSRSAFQEFSFDMHFNGEKFVFPFASPSNLHGARSAFEIICKIFSHGFIITSAIMVFFCKSSVMGVFLASKSVPGPVLLPKTEKVSIIDRRYLVLARFEVRIAPVWGKT